MSSFVYQQKKHLEKEKRNYESTLCTQYNGNPLGDLRLSQDNTINRGNTRIACQTRYFVLLTQRESLPFKLEPTRKTSITKTVNTNFGIICSNFSSSTKD